MYQLCGTFLSCVEQERYLGVLLSNNLDWAPHITNVATKASQKLGRVPQKQPTQQPTRTETTSIYIHRTVKLGIRHNCMGPPPS